MPDKAQGSAALDLATACGSITPRGIAISHAIRIRYQPIIRFADMRPVSVEVLARTLTDKGKITGPAPLIEAMTGGDVSIFLTATILERALAEYVEYGFQELGLEFAINLPLDAMLHPELLPVIETIRAQTNVPAANIRFELTERHPVEDIGRLNNVITTLLAAGYSLALDDVTPPMLNLDALLRLPLRAVKLDRSIVISDDPSDTAFIGQIVANAALHGHDVIAEGIETAGTLDMMRAQGVGFGQGYLFARPVSALQLRDFLNRWTQSEPPGGIVA